MRSKYEQKHFAVYDGIAFETYLTSDYKIGLITEDDKLVKKYCFKFEDDMYCKEVSPYEVTEYYQQHFKAKYRGVQVTIICGNDEGVDIYTYGDGDHEKMIKLGFEVPGRGEYLKSCVPISELTDVVCIKKNVLEYAKEDYDEEHPSEKKDRSGKFNLLKTLFRKNI